MYMEEKGISNNTKRLLLVSSPALLNNHEVVTQDETLVLLHIDV